MKQMKPRRQDRNKGKRKPEYMKSYGYYGTAFEAIKKAQELDLSWIEVKRSNNRWKRYCVCEFIQPHDPRPKKKKPRNRREKQKKNVQ